MKRVLFCCFLLIVLSVFPVCAYASEETPASPTKYYAAGPREGEVTNIGVAVYPDNSFEITVSTTERNFGALRYLVVYAENDEPVIDDHVLFLGCVPDMQMWSYRFYGGDALFPTENTYAHLDENEMLKPGRYYAIMEDEWGGIETEKAYFTIPDINLWWTPQPVPTAEPTPTEEPVVRTQNPILPTISVQTKASPVHTTVSTDANASDRSSVPLILCIIFGIIILAETVYIVFVHIKINSKSE